MESNADRKEWIRKLRAETGKSQSKFAQYFGIPVRSLQAWESGRTKPPEYIPGMMERILVLEQKVLLLEQENEREEDIGNDGFYRV